MAEGVNVRLERCRRYLQSDPENPNLLAEVFDLSLAGGHRDEARSVVERAMRLFPEAAHFRFRWATFCIAERRLSEAENVLKEISAMSPGPAVAYDMAYVHFLQGRHDEAIGELRRLRASADAPHDTDALLIRCLHHAGRIDEAAIVAQECLVGDSVSASVASAASLVMWDQGDSEAARRLAANALRKDPSAMEALVTEGSLALAAEDAELARRRFREALAQNPDDGRTWSGLALSSLVALDFETALAEFSRAVELMSGHIGTWHAFAWCKLLSSDLDGADAAFRRALALDPNFAESHGAMAIVAALRGNAASARAAVERALRLDRECLSARYAQALLDGEIQGTAGFRRFAQRLLSGRGGAGDDLLKRVLRRISRSASEAGPKAGDRSPN